MEVTGSKEIAWGFLVVFLFFLRTALQMSRRLENGNYLIVWNGQALENRTFH